jgi:hypothetical protein
VNQNNRGLKRSNVERLAPAAKAEKTRADFLRKVELLEACAKAGVDDNKEFPWTLDRLASWSDPERKINPWRKPNIVSAKRYADLRRRYENARLELSTKLKSPGRANEEASKRMLAEQEIVVLAQQIVTVRNEYNLIKRQLKLALNKEARRMKSKAS